MKRLITIILCSAVVLSGVMYAQYHAGKAAEKEQAKKDSFVSDMVGEVIDQMKEQTLPDDPEPEIPTVEEATAPHDAQPEEPDIPESTPGIGSSETDAPTGSSHPSAGEALRTPPCEDYNLEGELSELGYLPCGSAEDSYVYVNAIGQKIVITVRRHAEDNIMVRVGDGKGNVREFGRIFDCPESLDYSDCRVSFTCWVEPEGHRSEEELREYYSNTEPYTVTDKLPAAAVEEALILANRSSAS